jgi:septum formation topological specificity factor MinE
VKERLEALLELEPELEAEADEAERRLSLVLSAEREHHSVTDLIRSLL